MYYKRRSSKNCQFLNNTVSYNGGAISFWRICRLFDKQFRLCQQLRRQLRGAIASAGANLRMYNVFFDSNYSSGEGVPFSSILPSTSGIVSFIRTTRPFPRHRPRGRSISRTMEADRSTIAPLSQHQRLQVCRCGGAIHLKSNFSIPIKNCIFREIVQAVYHRQRDRFSYRECLLRVTNCLLQAKHGYNETNDLYNVDPLFIDMLHLRAGRRWLTADDGLQLTYYSPLVKLRRQQFSRYGCGCLGDNK